MNSFHARVDGWQAGPLFRISRLRLPHPLRFFKGWEQPYRPKRGCSVLVSWFLRDRAGILTSEVTILPPCRTQGDKGGAATSVSSKLNADRAFHIACTCSPEPRPEIRLRRNQRTCSHGRS